ncbi:glucan phosphoethanolaminetransferase (alkaline phosphatase superfamily) [Buttiauxella sp. JUb87]|uniref:phosphoethanolamine transferase n=1 Tax=Buttiauxella sp. JUb87 TaxID=2485129 RepID=UPI00105FB1F7|nr:phosphoethanolamine transferase [Buttiauxella sp. JUb87]TDN54673.1 glucan phosphoethanolaminetransferase (alkaline phosphatase superfamily) [Buttiauxella sp. JUb87]
MSLISEQIRYENIKIVLSKMLFVISVSIVVIVNFIGARYNFVINRTLVFVLLLLTLLCINNKLLKNLLGFIALTFIAVDLSLQLYAWNNFNTKFTYGFALSVMNTTGGEAFSMLGVYWRSCIVFVGLLILFMLTINCGINTIHSKYKRYPVILLVLLLTGYTVQGILHQLRKSNVDSLAQRVINSTPLSTGTVFMQAISDMSIASDINKNTPNYTISVSDTGIDNYVLIIGESERRENMSIYGYERDTTPKLEAERKNLLLFQHAISPAPVTIMALPLALTAASVQETTPAKYGDNIIGIANKAGYDTYWYSRQGKGGAYNNVITGIAMKTKQHQWIDQGFDDALLPELESTLTKSGKKLIVLHLYGSHEPACSRFPEGASVFKNGSTDDDCYDNSVRFTDDIMGKVFSQLSHTRSSVFYFSDHALIRDPSRAVVYSHAGANPPKEALAIPAFIWYSPKVEIKNKWLGDYQTPWSTDDANMLSELWLGIHRADRNTVSMQEWLQKYQKPIIVMDTTGKKFNWKNMH